MVRKLSQDVCSLLGRLVIAAAKIDDDQVRSQAIADAQAAAAISDDDELRKQVLTIAAKYQIDLSK